jgi:hypothetical protein
MKKIWLILWYHKSALPLALIDLALAFYVAFSGVKINDYYPIFKKLGLDANKAMIYYLIGLAIITMANAVVQSYTENKKYKIIVLIVYYIFLMAMLAIVISKYI